MNLKKYLIFILFTLSINCVWSQTNFYMGGTSGTGTGIKSILIAAACTPTYDTSVLFYRGGNYSSASSTSISSISCPTRIDTILNFYRGGNYGSSSSTLINASTCTVFIDSTVSFYKGGTYGGTNSTTINSSVCVYALDSSVLIYKGGTYGSYSSTNISPTTCPYPDPINIWMGGASSNNASGFLNNTVSNNTNGPFISSISDTTILNGNCLTLTTTGVGATSYSWSPSNGLSNVSIASPIANPTTTTTYTVTATGSTPGCRNVYSVTVNVNNNNGVTSISYPSQISTNITTVQPVTLTGITNGVFSSSSTNLKLSAANGSITPNTSTVGNYTVTYTYGACNNTVITPVVITNDNSYHGEIIYPNFYLGAATGTAIPRSLLSQSTCTVALDYTTMLYTGGTSGTLTPKSILSQAACTSLIDYTLSFIAGGTSGSATPKSILTQGACTPYIEPSNTIYMGGTSGSNTAKAILSSMACTYPVGNNFYIGGAGSGYGNGSLTPSTSAINGTAVATRSDTTICPGTPIVLNTTGATNYTWTPATGLDNTLNANPTAIPMSTTTYTVVGTGSGVGCINTAKVTVTVLKDSLTSLSYGAYSFDENDLGLKKVNYIYGPLTGTYAASPSGLFLNTATGAFTPGLSTSGIYAISYNYTKGVCNYSFVSNVNITTLPPSISYPSPSVFYVNYAGTTVSPLNVGGRALGYELIDSLPAGLTINLVTGVISGTATTLVENAQVRVRAFNYTKVGTTNYSDTYTMTISVRKPIINSITNSITSMNTTYGLASPETTFNVSGKYIIQNILVTPPTGFEVSKTTGSGFTNTVTITQSGGNITNTTIYLRIKSNASVGNLTGTINLSSIASDDFNIPIATSYVAPAPLTITAKYFQKFYGSKLILGVGNKNFTSSGLLNGESIGSVTLTASGGTAPNDPVGLYDITPSAAVDGTFSPANYNITYTKAQFEVLYSLYNFQLTGNTSNWVKGKVPAPKLVPGIISNLTSTDMVYISSIPAAFINIAERGVSWGTNINPTISVNKLADPTNVSGSMTSNVTGLISGTTYYIRSYITVGNYTYYGPNVKFTTQ